MIAEPDTVYGNVRKLNTCSKIFGYLIYFSDFLVLDTLSARYFCAGSTAGAPSRASSLPMVSCLAKAPPRLEVRRYTPHRRPLSWKTLTLSGLPGRRGFARGRSSGRGPSSWSVQTLNH